LTAAAFSSESPDQWLAVGEVCASRRWRCVMQGNADHSSAPLQADEKLLEQYKRGDYHAFSLLYERHRAGLLRFVKRMAPSEMDYEEITQETWMAVIKGRERFEPRARFVTYLFSIAQRRTADRWRQVSKWPRADTDILDELVGSAQYEPDRLAQSLALGADLTAAIGALPLRQREAFLLRAEGGLSLDEIAQVTGANRETAKSRLRFALVRLRNLLEPWHDE
jgi:RNA polymerase sigma-70 factor (ECF subfamily)